MAAATLPHQIVALFFGKPQKLQRWKLRSACALLRADGSESELFPVFSGVRQGCVVAPGAFLVPMDWLLEHTVHRCQVGTSVGKEIFTDLDFADDVSILAEMLSVLVLALEVMNEEAKPLGLTINWAKTKIQTTDTTYVSPGTFVQVGGSSVEIVDIFTYLGSQLHSSGGSALESNRQSLHHS